MDKVNWNLVALVLVTIGEVLIYLPHALQAAQGVTGVS
jgi:hypothetical protein